MIHAAGILFLAPNDRALFLKRGKDGDHAGEWCLPGGKLEKDELPEDAAEREAREEIGFLPAGIMVEHTRRQDDSVDFTTFRQHVSEEFRPSKKALNEEHVGYAWAPVSEPPEPLHPGCRVVLDRLGMDELGVARAIAAGELVSPQDVENMSLFAMRMSGTGASYRKGLDEYVWRDPEIYLSQDMIDRCAGLPLLLEHPQASTLNSEEFANRIIGTVMFAYVKGDDLWCIARVYDDAARTMMKTEQLSTSPAVVFRDPSVNSKVKMEDGTTLLIEGKPSLLDHLCVTPKGVWDKGGPATGIQLDIRSDSEIAESDEQRTRSRNMTDEKGKADAARKDAEEAEMKKKEEEAKADAAKADAEAGQKLDKLLSCMDSLSKRMDAWDAKMDAEEEEKKKADAAKKDADEKEEEEKKADASKKDEDGEIEEKGDPKELKADKAKKDAEEMADSRKDSDEAVKRLVSEQVAAALAKFKTEHHRSDADEAELAAEQSRADQVYSIHSKSAPRPMEAETVIAYKKRLASGMQSHSAKWKDADLGRIAIADPKTFDSICDAIYADAVEAGKHPVSIGEMELREVRRRDPDSGHMIKEYYGDPSAWMSQFSGGRRVARFNLGNRS